MAKSGAADKSTQEDVHELIEQIGTLKSDVAAIAKTLAELGTHSKEAAQAKFTNSVAQLQERGAESVEAARAGAHELGNQAAEAVRRQPATAVGLAVGVGFLLGFLTGRK